MNANPQVSTAEGLGKWIGRRWRGLVQREDRLVDRLSKAGLPTVAVRIVLWMLKLAVLAVLVYTMLGVAILIAIAGLVAWTLKNSDLDTKPAAPEWRQGFHGFGLYDEVGHRIDPHDSNRDQ